MSVLMFPAAGLALGLALGFLCPVLVPLALTKYVSVTILAALDAVFGGLRAGAEGTFGSAAFLVGFASDALLAALLVFLGDRLGIDLYSIALLVFGFRIFQNLARLRRLLLKKPPSEA